MTSHTTPQATSRPLRANPGGQLAPEEVLGRDPLIQRLWRILQRQSLVLSAERRIGKTSIIRKMAQEQSDDILIFQDLERVHSVLEFVETIFRDVEAYLGRLNRTGRLVREFLEHLQGAEIGGLIKFPETAARHWKTLLTRTFDDLMGQVHCRVVFFWDELPFMIYNIAQREGESAAMELLDTLRALRQTYGQLRMVFTGSIGLHNVLSSLKRAGYANDPTNDMYLVDVPPLEPEDAEHLTRRLFEGERLAVEDPAGVSRHLAGAVDRLPFLIHHVVDQLALWSGPVRMQTVSRVIDSALLDPQDPWHLRYFRERLDTYYTPDERPFALALLDCLAVETETLAFGVLFDRLKLQVVTEDHEMVRSVLVLLQKDHYVVQHTDGSYRFRFPLIRRFWRLSRGL